RNGDVLFLSLPGCGCGLSSSLQSLSSGAWYRATVQAKVNIDKTAIIGAGSWGTALAWLWGRDGRQISLWGNSAGRGKRMRNSRENFFRPYSGGVIGTKSRRGSSAQCADCDGNSLSGP